MGSYPVPHYLGLSTLSTKYFEIGEAYFNSLVEELKKAENRPSADGFLTGVCDEHKTLYDENK